MRSIARREFLARSPDLGHLNLTLPVVSDALGPVAAIRNNERLFVATSWDCNDRSSESTIGWVVLLG